MQNPFRNILPNYMASSEPVRKISRAIMLASVVGSVAGVIAFVFDLLYLVCSRSMLGFFANYESTDATYVPFLDIIPIGSDFMPWMLLVVPTIGGLIAGFLVYYFAPEAAGPGTNAAIIAYHRRGGKIRGRVPLIKMIASAITLGSGGSGGREGPIAQIGAGIGSYIGQKFKLKEAERRVLLAAGLGAGIGAIFHAPLAGAIFAVEVLYRDPDFEAEALIPSFFSTVIAYSLYSLLTLQFFGIDSFNPLFAIDDSLKFNPIQAPVLVLPLTVLAILLAFGSFFFTQWHRFVHFVFYNLPIPNHFKPAIGGFLTGVTALCLFYLSAHFLSVSDSQHSLAILSTGFGFLKESIDNPQGIAIGLFAIIAFGKILTTSFTIGSGGSAGLFGPSMIIGASLGAIVALGFASTTNLVSGEYMKAFMILGMAGFFAGAANAPLSTLIMVSELTGKYELLIASMWVCALTYVLSRNWSLFHGQVDNRVDSPAHRGDFMVDILDGLSVRDAMTRTKYRITTVAMGMTLEEVVNMATENNQTVYPVLQKDQSYYGIFSLEEIRQFLKDTDPTMSALTVAQDLAHTNIPSLTLSTTLDEAVHEFAKVHMNELPVFNPADPTEVVGLLSMDDIITVYNARLMRTQGHAQQMDIL